MTKKKKIKQASALLLVFALIISGIFAFLTAQDSKTNVFTIGNVNIDLIEDFDVNTDKELDPDTEHFVDEQPPVVEDIVPGQEILKQPYIENTGSNDAWVYMVVKQPTATAEQIAGVDGSLTETQQEIVINAYAFQDNYKGAKTAEDVWAAYAPDLDGDAEHSTEPRELIFELKGIDTTNWTKLNSESFLSEDGYYYEVYAYNTILPAKDNDTTTDVIEDQTSKLFTSVKLNSDIESAAEHVIKFMDNGKFVTAIPFISKDTVITIPDDIEKWIAPSNKVFSAGDTVKVEDLLEKKIVVTDDEIIAVPQVTDTVIVNSVVPVTELNNSSTVIPKLVPKTTSSTAMIERDGVVETYNSVTSAEVKGDVTVVSVNDVRYATPDSFESYFVYGIVPTETVNDDKALEYLNNALDVDGEGYLEIIPEPAGTYGTGAIIKVYNNNGQLTEQFYHVMFGDISGDGLINASDSGYFKAALERPNYSISKDMPLVIKTCDADGDGKLDIADLAALKVVLKSKNVDQITGYYLTPAGEIVLGNSSVVTVKLNDKIIDSKAVGYRIGDTGYATFDLKNISINGGYILGLDANKNAAEPTYKISKTGSGKGTVNVSGVSSDMTLYVIYSFDVYVWNIAHVTIDSKLTSITVPVDEWEFKASSTLDTTLVGVGEIPDGYTFIGWHILKASDIEEHTCYDIETGDEWADTCTKTFTVKDVNIAPNGTLTIDPTTVIEFGGDNGIFIAPVVVPN